MAFTADDRSPAVPSSGRLTAPQGIACAVWGAVLWFVAAMAVRYGVPMGLYEGGALAVLFVATVPATGVLVWSVRRVARLHVEQVVAGVAIAGAVATMLDGLGLAFTDLYGTDRAGIVNGAAWILWGVGTGQVLAHLVTHRVP